MAKFTKVKSKLVKSKITESKLTKFYYNGLFKFLVNNLNIHNTIQIYQCNIII